MVLPQAFSALQPAPDLRDHPDGQAKEVLGEEEKSRQNAQVTMERVEVGQVVDVLVDLDDDGAGEEEEKGEDVEAGVRASAGEFCFGGCGWLEDEDGLKKRVDAERFLGGLLVH